MERKNRRSFIAKAGLGILGVPSVTKKNVVEEVDQRETQLLLTPDGKLVEVPKSVIQSGKKQDVRSKRKLWTWLQSKGSPKISKISVKSK
ncbi:MAG: hypothetical protein OEQ53_13325 [Saprospiraceae bacterium]|nr:hypothetical protein [Saprospiraceae bacterium]